MKTFLKRIAVLSIAAVLLFQLVEMATANRAPDWGAPGWVQFPSNDFSRQYDPGIDVTSQARLALTAEGSEVAMTYTPATYQIRSLPGQHRVELQIYDALVSSGDPESADLGWREAVMALVFGSGESEGEWQVYCGGETVATPSEPQVLVVEESACGFRRGAWSNSIVVKTKADGSLPFKTVWAGSSQTENFGDKPANYRDLINVFRFQTRNGVAQLAPTNPDEIMRNDGTPLSWKTHEHKPDYEHRINWSVLYKTSTKAFYSFEVDVSNIRGDFLYLWDKDADANQLFLSKGKDQQATPPDDGLKMLVRWSNGDPLKYNPEQDLLEGGIPMTSEPEWTHFDQTNRSGFSEPWSIPGETNQFDGPSWDTDKDPAGIDSIRWYKIPLFERKSDKVLVGWYGSIVPNNAFAFAASGPVSPAPCGDPAVCEEEFLDEGDETEDHKDHDSCVSSGHLRACISSDPAADPDDESFGLDPTDEDRDEIRYLLELKNTAEEDEVLKDVTIRIDPPPFTTLSPELWAEIEPEEGGSYTGKSPGMLKAAEDLGPGEVITFEIPVLLDVEPELKDYDIESGESFRAGAEEHPAAQLPGLVHHVGKGGVNIEASRCYGFDIINDFRCSESCEAVEPGTVITVRDTLKNVGGATVVDFEYHPLPLSQAFDYIPQSIRLDDHAVGLSVTNDGTLFPPENGISVTGPLNPDQQRMVFFQYRVPIDLLNEDTSDPNNQTPEDQPSSSPGSCFPDDEEVLETDQTEPLVYDPVCQLSDTQFDKEAEHPEGRICVKADPEARLEAILSATPEAESTVYRGSSIRYVLSIQNMTQQPIEELTVEAAQAEQTLCREGSCQGVTIQEPLELSQKFGVLTFSYSLQVNDDAEGEQLLHSGHRIRFRAADGIERLVESNTLNHVLLAAPEPTGDFQHDIQLSRRTLLNAAEHDIPRQDQADRTTIEHLFRYSGTQQQPVWPIFDGQRSYQHNVCNSQYPSFEYYDASFNSFSYVYNSAQPQASLFSFDQIRSAGADFEVTTTAPEQRPELIRVDNGQHKQVFQHAFSGANSGRWQLNNFMQHGGQVTSIDLPTTELRAVRDGIGGLIMTQNQAKTPFGQGEMREDLWQYIQVDSRIDRNRCLSCGRKYCSRYDAVVPLYRWEVVSDRMIPLLAEDRDYVSVLSSVAWLKTQNGHLGFGTPLWEQGPSTGDPNWVDVGDAFVPSFMKFYTPPTETNADLLIFSPGNTHPLRSGLGGSGVVDSSAYEQGFLTDGHVDPQLSRGEAYDREVYPRDYFDDLIYREIYGRVIHLHSSPTLPSGISRLGDTVFMNGPVTLEADTVYFVDGNLVIGKSGGDDVIIDGGRARLVVKGSASIAANVHYADSGTAEVSQIPSVRLHATEHIRILPSVTEVELMMLAEQEFHSGRSDKQLRILGDVIAEKAFWERSPLRNDRTAEEMVNKPSELIIEDFRKVLAPPPGDMQLSDTGDRVY